MSQLTPTEISVARKLDRDRDLKVICRMRPADFALRMDLLRRMVAADPKRSNYGTRCAYDELESLGQLKPPVTDPPCAACGRHHRPGTDPKKRHRS